MTTNANYWRNWFTWAQTVALTQARKGDLLGAAAFLAEVANTVQLAFEPFDSLAACFKGNFFQIAGKLTAWAANHHDPLGAFRHAAEGMKTKWGFPPSDTAPLVGGAFSVFASSSLQGTPANG